MNQSKLTFRFLCERRQELIDKYSKEPDNSVFRALVKELEAGEDPYKIIEGLVGANQMLVDKVNDSNKKMANYLWT